VPARLGPQVEGDPGAIFGHLHGLGQQAVAGEGLVGRRLGQGVVDVADAGRRIALDDEGVETVEAADGRQLDDAALGGVGPHVVELLEIGAVLGIAVHGDGVDRRGRQAGRPCRPVRQGEENEGRYEALARRHHVRTLSCLSALRIGTLR